MKDVMSASRDNYGFVHLQVTSFLGLEAAYTCTDA
jgi:hypothetical protein